MPDSLLAAFKHSAWANRELIAFCRGLSPEQLATKGPDTAYGSILETLQHMVGSESFYRFMFTGAFSDWGLRDDIVPTLDQFETWFAELAASWEKILEKPIDADTLLVQTTPNDVRHEESAGIMLVQVVHHAAIHREQINAVLTNLGIEPPDLDARAYGASSG